MRSAVRWLTNALRFVWASPWTIIGFAVGLATLATGGSGRRVGGIFEFWGGASRWLLQRAPTGSGGARAMTIGYVVIGQTDRDLIECREHELVHVRQYGVWGLFFVPAYFASSLWEWLHGRDPYLDNRFEREAFGNG